MALEIEHKYLVVNDSYRSMAERKLEITQGYLSREPLCTVRVRIIGDRAFITIKGQNQGDTRQEFEYDIPIDEAKSLLMLCQPGVIYKTRYLVNHQGNLWEVDEFHGRLDGLVVAEIEIPHSGHTYAKPPFVGENVTDDSRYYNSNLSKL
jgi:adenylate cyclase